MSFESGSLSCRMFYVPQELPGNAIERFAADAAPSLEALSREEIRGWVTSRHLLDRNITEDTVLLAGYLRLDLMKGERKIPNALLRAECLMEELAEMEVRGVTFLKRQDKIKIKKEVTDRLLPNMPPTLTGMSLVYSGKDKLAYATAISEKQMDALTISFSNTAGVDLIPMTPATAAAQRRGLDITGIPPASLSPECDNSEVGISIGQDFLTWLWFFSEHRGGIANIEPIGQLAVIIEDPLVFVMEGAGAHEATLRKGTPLISMEAKTALLAGKKLRRAKLTLARGEEVWSAYIDADEFIFRSLKVPKGEAFDPIGRLQERMLSIETFRDAFLSLYDRFLGERADADKWQNTLAEIHQWVKTRQTRR